MSDQANEGLLSPFLHNRRIKAAVRFLKGSILDVGCGSGALAKFVPEHRYFGIDMDSASIEVAKQNYPAHSFENTLSILKSGFRYYCRACGD